MAELPISSEFKVELPIDLVVPDDLAMLYSDHMVVKNQDGMFVLYFFQHRQPVVLTPEEANAVEKIESKCVAQILLTPQQMGKILIAMQSNFQRFIKKMESEAEGNTEGTEVTKDE